MKRPTEKSRIIYFRAFGPRFFPSSAQRGHTVQGTTRQCVRSNDSSEIFGLTRVARWAVLDDQVDVRHIDTAGGNVSRHQDLEALGAERLDGLVALVLGDVTVKNLFEGQPKSKGRPKRLKISGMGEGGSLLCL